MDNQENNMEVHEDDNNPEPTRLTKSKSIKKTRAKNPFNVLLAESILISGALPIVLFFFVGVINSVILMVYQSEYTTCIAIKKVEKVLAGGSQSDISDNLKGHIIG